MLMQGWLISRLPPLSPIRHTVSIFLSATRAKKDKTNDLIKFYKPRKEHEGAVGVKHVQHRS